MSQSAPSCIFVEEGATSVGSTKKNKIDLADYDYKKDIENRLVMASFSPFDVEVLEEILLSSLTFSATGLASTLEVKLSDLDATLEKLERVGLLQRDGDLLVVDKEMRKYYEFQASKFDSRFEPNMEFLQGLLRKVPIHILPVWYAIPRSSTNIFESVLERFLETPRAFQRYLTELQLEDPVQRGIVQHLFSSPELKIPSRELREEFALSAEQFEEQMLHLEFNFICCLSFERVEDRWEEIVTPFHEWRQFLLFRQETMPQPIATDAEVHQLRTAEFAVVQDMSAILRDLQSLSMEAVRKEGSRLFEVNAALASRLAAVCGIDAPLVEECAMSVQSYFSRLIGKLALIEFVDEGGGAVAPTPTGEEWLSLDIEERAIALYRHPFNTIISREIDPLLNSEQNLREIERTLERVAHLGWVEMEEFLRGVIAPIGEAKDVALQRQGRRWCYQLPTYTQDEKELIRAAILERFFEGGFVEVAESEGSHLFRVTPFGKAVIAGGATTSH